MKWVLSVATVLPLVLASAAWFVITKPWFCSGLCCLHVTSCPVPSLHGTFQPQYKPVVDTLQRSLAQGWDLGASLFVAVDGETVVDVAGGYKDAQKTEPYDESTVNVIFSSGKVIEAIAMAILVDNEFVDLNAPVAKYWKEFANKGGVTIQDMLSHRSGSATLFEETPSVEILKDPKTRDEFLASQKFQLPRGTVAYRAWGSALYSDAISRRVDPKGRSLSRLVQEEVFDQLGETFFCPPLTEERSVHFSQLHDIPLATVLLGFLPQLFMPRLYAKIVDKDHPLLINPLERPLFRSAILDKDSILKKPTIPDVGSGAASYNNHSSFLAYEMMSSNCISNARAIGKAFDAFMKGRIVREETLNAFLAPFPSAFDKFLLLNVTHTKGGFGVSSRADISMIEGLLPESSTCYGWGGVGGSLIQHCIVDGHTITVSYVMNSLSPKLVLDRGSKLVHEAIKVMQKQ
uniref:Beta-lactamase-related domain-containing protein n=1 Tax=Attheya septentrionalis TaxID=420275 RepID=A0A6T7HMA1_9STRA|mmetsp:Transcript_21587/g.39057  ORF Transcript_21587/g.39057 Transcript_21587/m.39057 type:complete len:461 (+) Transcript_21587:201-1583(+)